MKHWTILEILNWTTDYFDKQNIDNARLNAELIIAHVLGYKRFDLYLNFDEPILPPKRELLKKYIVRRANHEPIQYILEETTFYGYTIRVNSNVLIPRPETEYLVELILVENEGKRKILEIGTGSGAISIALKNQHSDFDIVATDVSVAALRIAEQNAKENKANLMFVQSDLFESIAGKFDIIVSNPPYISEEEYATLSKEVCEYEPRSALVAPEEGFYYYRNILSEARSHLNENGLIYLEIGSQQAAKIKMLAEKYGYKILALKKDLNGFDRILKLGMKYG